MAKMMNQSGQAVTEYILIMAVVVGIYILITGAISQTNLANSLLKPLNETFAFTYKNGHPLARSWDDPGGPTMHPRIVGGDNLRIFINPGQQSGDGL